MLSPRSSSGTSVARRTGDVCEGTAETDWWPLGARGPSGVRPGAVSGCACVCGVSVCAWGCTDTSAFVDQAA